MAGNAAIDMNSQLPGVIEQPKDLFVDIPVNLEDPNRCTKDDEYKTSPCTCAACISAENTSGIEKQPYVQKGVVVTDNDLVPNEIVQWVGYTFICPSCGKPSILDMMNYCPNCGIRALIRSHKVTDFINKLELKQTNK